MADETTQTGEETSWWAFDDFAESELPSTSFDEPLEWPETLDWGDVAPDGGDLRFPGIDDPESAPIFPPAPAPEPPTPQAGSPEAPPSPAGTQWQAANGGGDPTMPHVTILSGLGGGAPSAPPAAAEQTVHERLPDSLWGGAGNGHGTTPVVSTTMAAPTVYAEPDGGGGGWRRRFDIRHGNAAVIALISFVSLILLGMFMSVRARNDVPDTSQTRTTSDQIKVQGTLNTVPLTTTVTTTAPPPINIADLVPAPEDATTPSAGAGSTGAAGGGSAPATTAAPRSTPAGGSTGTTQAAAQPTNTTAAPQTTAPPETTTPTSAPDDTTATTRPRLTTTVPATTVTTEYTVPTFPPEFGITVPTSPRRGF